jgi:hypothetical protein
MMGYSVMLLLDTAVAINAFTILLWDHTREITRTTS